jgi:K+-sensing histidine kinase KdpD
VQRYVARIPIARSAVAVLSVAAVVVCAWWLRPFVLAAAHLLLVAILITGWVSGLRPALVACGLAMLAFDYYFTPPYDSLKIEAAERHDDAPENHARSIPVASLVRANRPVISKNARRGASSAHGCIVITGHTRRASAVSAR